MVQKKLPLINSAHGSETRNIINELIKLFNGMGYTYNESLQKAHDILDEAQQTNDMNESVQQQINTLIAESGTSDAEVLQARIDAEGNEYPVLKDRLDEKEQNFSAQLAQITSLPKGKETAALGEELISDNWVVDESSWTGNYIDGFSHIEGTTGSLSYPLNAIANKIYQVEVTVSAPNSSARNSHFEISIGDSEPFDLYQGAGTLYTYKRGIRAVNNGDFVITPLSTFNGTITSVSIKEVVETIEPTLRVLDEDGNSTFEMRPTDGNLRNVHIGRGSGKYTTSGHSNTSLGHNSLANNTSGFWNSVLGHLALSQNTVGSRNIAIGHIALQDNISGHRNVGVGSFALNRVTHGANNIGIGADAGWYITTGTGNLAIGYRSLDGNSTGINNTAVGHMAGDNGAKGNASFSDNTLIGATTGTSMEEGADRNILIGQSAGHNLKTGTDNIVIGTKVSVSDDSASDYLNIGNTIYGDMSYWKKISIGGNPIYSGDSINNGIKLQVGASSRVGILELWRERESSGSLGGIQFINTKNDDTSSNTRQVSSYILSESVTTNDNAGLDAGADLSFFTKNDGGTLNRRMHISDNGRISIGTSDDPEAILNIGAGNTQKPPLKLSSGNLVYSVSTVPGAIEYDGTNLYLTTDDGVRREIAFV